MSSMVLVRYGAIPEVARFADSLDASLDHGVPVVVRSHRGVELGTYLGRAVPPAAPLTEEIEHAPAVLRPATADDLQKSENLRSECERDFSAWRRRIADWKLQLELIDLERTLDGEKLILYVLNDRGPECTRLALQAAAAGLGIVEVQPVGAEGLIAAAPSGGGCGTGCGSGGCHN